MKTIISLPDKLFSDADHYAQQRDMTRSELYAKALGEYLQRHGDEHITEKINAALDKMLPEHVVSEDPLDSLRQLPW